MSITVHMRYFNPMNKNTFPLHLKEARWFLENINVVCSKFQLLSNLKSETRYSNIRGSSIQEPENSMSWVKLT